MIRNEGKPGLPAGHAQRSASAEDRPASGGNADSERTWLQRHRRQAILWIGMSGLALGLYTHWRTGAAGEKEFASNSALRVGVVMTALWLALPTLNKPIRWLPPGAALLCLVALGAVAAQPKLLLIVVPAVGFLLTLGWAVRIFQLNRRR